MSVRFNKYKYTARSEVTVISGTPVPLAAIAQRVVSVIVQARPTNTGIVYLGESDVALAKSAKLLAGQSMTISLDTNLADEDFTYIDLNDLYIGGTVTGDKVDVQFLQLIAEQQNAPL